MAWVPLPITGPAYRNADERELDTQNAQVMDCVVNELGDTVKRPGLEEFVDLGTSAGVDGFYWWDEQSVLIAVSAGRTWKITDSSGNKTELTGATMLSGNRVSFAADGTQVLMANRGAMVTFPIDGPLLTMADADAPAQVAHVLIHDQTAIATVLDSSSFQFSEPGDILAWRALDVSTAEAKPDRIVASLNTTDGFLLFGKESTEFWVNDGVSPFSRIRGLTLNRGCGAPYSIAYNGEEWLWLDDKRRVVRATLQEIKEVSIPIESDLQDLSSAEDGVGDYITVNGWSLYVLTFPLANRTFVYDLRKNSWVEWGRWDTTQGVYRRFRGNCYAYAKAWNYHLVGDYTNGKIYKLSRAVYQDDGETLRSLRRTGFITHKTSNNKRSKKLRIRLKRGTATASVANPVMLVRWRESGGAWSPMRSMELGAVGEHGLFLELSQLGIYRARQYEFIHADATDWIMADGQEDVEALSR